MAGDAPGAPHPPPTTRIRLEPKWWGAFTVGERLPWKGVTFKVAAVGPAGLLLAVDEIDVKRMVQRLGSLEMVEVKE